MNATIEISMSAAKDLIPCLEARLANAEDREIAAREEAASVRNTLAELRIKVSGGEPKPNGEVRQRLPKGHGDKLIIGVLKASGEGLTAAEIKRRTGVNHSTIFRTLNEPKRNKGRFEKVHGKDGVWRLKSAT